MTLQGNRLELAIDPETAFQPISGQHSPQSSTAKTSGDGMALILCRASHYNNHIILRKKTKTYPRNGIFRAKRLRDVPSIPMQPKQWDFSAHTYLGTLFVCQKKRSEIFFYNIPCRTIRVEPTFSWIPERQESHQGQSNITLKVVVFLCNGQRCTFLRPASL